MTKRHAFSVVLLFSIVVLAVTIGVAIAAQQEEAPTVAVSTNEEVLVNAYEIPYVDGMVEGEMVNSAVLVVPEMMNVNATADVQTNTAAAQPTTAKQATKKAVPVKKKTPVKKNTNVTKPTNTSANTNTAVNTNSAPAPTSTADLFDAAKKEITMQLVSSAENSTLNWKAQYGYIEDIGDSRGYTGGIIGFTSGTHDMLQMVQYYAQIAPGNILQKYIPALQQVDGSSSHSGLGTAYVNDWKTAAADPKFQEAQNHERDVVYFNPAVNQAKADGLRALGQFIYYDAMVMHGPGNDSVSFGGIRATALKKAKSPAQGGNETTYLHAFLDARKAAMLTEAAHDDTSRVDTAQRVFLNAGNLDLNTPLSWKTYGDSYTIK
jgi:chitosanase